MNRAVSVLFMAALGALAAAAQPKWITMENENFHMYSSANARDTMDALNYFERVRGFFLQMMGAPPPKPVPVYVVMFGSEKEYLPFRFKEFAIAYYAGQSDRDFIVMGKTGEQTAQVATHEYAHLVFRHAGYNFPPWLNEGMAELFSTMKPLGGDTEFGNVILGRLQALQRERWVPLETILNAGPDSSYYNETARAGSLYNEGWALVHMLMTIDANRAKFWDMVRLIDTGTPSVQAIEKVYGMPLAQMERDLKLYVSGMSFRKLITKVKLEGMEKLKAQPADMFDVRAVQASLLMGLPGKQAEARTRFEELTREDAKRPEPWASLGYLAWRDGKPQDAVASFAKAYELGVRSPRLLWDFARLAMRERPDDSARALEELIEVEPKNTDARVELANLRMSQRKYPEALAAIKAITSVKTVEQRDRILYMRAFSALQTGDQDEARARAEELKLLTKDATVAERADGILRFLNQPVRQAATVPVVTPSPVTPPPAPIARNDGGIVMERPIVRQRPEERETQPATRADMEIILQDVRGTLVEMNCAAPARFVLDTEQGRKTFLILQPERLIVTGRTGGAEFACGPQKPAPSLRLQFTIAPEGSDADGVVRAVHFGQN